MVVKIDNYDIASDLFTFPYNPKSYDSNIEANVSISDYAFSNNIILSANGTRKPKEIVLNGHFSGEDRWTNYRKLAKHFGENNVLKKLYFESDKFM
ncbi:MAG: hypothetical protein EOL97_15595, partial [Spirochaetia bacterium]|nr:hypothetical protein [Spirochaetia bacterium]